MERLEGDLASGLRYFAPVSDNPAGGDGGIKRKDFLDLAIAATAGLTAVGISLPALAYVWPPAEVTKRAGQRVKVAEPGEIPPGKAKAVLMDGKPVLVVNAGERLIALMAACPHLGCAVKWNEADSRIFCPCHGATFDLRGNVLSGPSPAPLSSVPVTQAKDGIYLG